MTHYDSLDDNLSSDEERSFRGWLKGLKCSRAATRADLDKLIELKPALMFDKSDIGARYVDSLVRRSPASVSSKRLDTKLPLELWFDILHYCSVQPNYVLATPQNTTPDGKLVLWELRSFIKCGYMKWYHLILHDIFLDRPRWSESPVEWSFDSTRPGDPPAGDVFELDLSYLETHPGVLLTNITPQDVIARMEGGDCGHCLGKRATTYARQGLRPCLRCTGYYFAKAPRDSMDPAYGVLKKKCVTLGYGYEVFTACGLPVPPDRNVDKL